MHVLLLGMERIGVRELRQHASRYLAMVKQGQTVEVTERGELVALLVAPHPSAVGREQLIAEGRLVPAAHPRRTLPEPLVIAGPTNAKLLEAEREDRL